MNVKALYIDKKTQKKQPIGCFRIFGKTLINSIRNALSF